MNVNDIDKFRNDFFEKLIKEERKKENEINLARKNCFHKYEIKGINDERICSKCGHIILNKAYKLNNQCTIM